ncbi:MAG: zf-HC2 domain-containing protein [Planctomycetes bacterium]|nr:zf-HC2 domain-containing protein [Planctomycetota bacterium]
MNCEDARPLLVGMAHGDLAPSEEPAVREHLASCADCRAAEADYGKVRALLRSAGRRDADGEVRPPEPAGILRVVLQALLEGRASGPDPAPAPPAAPATLVPSPPRAGARLRRLLGLTAGLAVVAFIAFPLRPSGRREAVPGRDRRLAGPVRVVELPDPDRLLAGPVRIEVEPERLSVLEVEGSRIEARGPAAYVARLWVSWESFESGADLKTRAWASQTGLVLAGWPILEVAAVSGLVTVQHEGRTLAAGPGEVVFVTPNRFPLLREWR